MIPTLGRIVIYRMSADDADAMNKRRADFEAYLLNSGLPTGHIGHFGNKVRSGQEYPAVVVTAWSPGLVNLQVFLDGNDTLWATSRKEGDLDGNWHWPVTSPDPQAIDAAMRALQGSD